MQDEEIEAEPDEGTEPEEADPQETEPQETEPQATEPQEAEPQATEPQDVTEPGEENEPEAEPETQGAVVTEYEQIKLSSELIGFEGLTVTYQWQVDRGDGEGWVDVEGATRENHVFRATRETIQYSWRLIVNIVDDE